MFKRSWSNFRLVQKKRKGNYRGSLPKKNVNFKRLNFPLPENLEKPSRGSHHWPIVRIFLIIVNTLGKYVLVLTTSLVLVINLCCGSPDHQRAIFKAVSKRGGYIVIRNGFFVSVKKLYEWYTCLKSFMALFCLQF